MIGVPDMKQAEVYENEIKPNLSKGKTFFLPMDLRFTSVNQAPRGVSVIMVAPKGPVMLSVLNIKKGKAFLLLSLF